jgi:limonene-1,2-epoxide hydrolase
MHNNLGGVGRTSSMSAPEEVVRDFMAAFISAWPTGDSGSLGRFFSADAEYRNGSLDAVRGRDAIVDDLSRMMKLGGKVDAHIRTLVADGTIVMTERVDYVTLGSKRAGLRVAGVFEVHDGVITAWRDYFDPEEFAAQLFTE